MKKTIGVCKMNKGELMKIKYSREQLKNIDPSLPLEIINDLRTKKQDTYFFVMNYNNSIFGILEDMRTINK